jgi:hypothetical protein
MVESGQQRRLYWFDRFALSVIVVLFVAFGALAVTRSAFLKARHTDFTVYTAAAWAVRTGQDIYRVTDEDGLHYCYPPTFATLMTPFAEPPSADGRLYLPFAVSVAIWYLLSVGFAAAACHLIAAALERTEAPTPTGSALWWRRRYWPFLICLPGIGHTLSHGQVNTLLLMLVCGFIAAVMLGRMRTAGVWLAGAVALKVIPAFLALAPILRRDRAFVGGFAAGLVVFLLGVPAVVLGPVGAWNANRAFVDAMIAPALNGADSADRAAEMFHVLKTDNQSIMAVLHAWRWWGDPAAPAEPSGRARAAHWALGGILTLATLLAARGRPLTGPSGLQLLGSLTAVMLFVSPMCHLHYYCLTVPLVNAVLHRDHTSPTRIALIAVHVVGVTIPLVFESIRNFGFAPLGTLPLWWLAVRDLRQPINTANTATFRVAA